MKNNGPVTQRDIPMRPGMAIISHTDSKGRITYVNDDFVEISGFTRDECLGKSHNMVRHPDMPPEAFRDLWDTVKAGRPWQGIVKNRCKNGDHYWVKATVTPREDGNYMSVRTAPSVMEVRQAEHLYADMLRHDNYRLQGGVVHKKGASSVVSRLHAWMGNRSFFTKLTAPMLIVWTLAIGVVAYQMNTMRTESLMIAGQHSAQDLINKAFNARSFYAEHVLPKARNAGLEMTHDFVGKMHAVPLPASLMRSIAEMSANNAGESAQLRLYSNQPFKFRTAAESRLDTFETEAFDYLSKNPNEFYARIEQTDKGPVYRYARADVMREQACITCHNNHPDTPKKDWKIGDVRGVIAASMPLNSLHAAQTKSMLGLAITLLSVLTFSIVAMLWIARKQKQNLDTVARIADDISHGDLTTEVPQGRTDEVGRIFGALQIMRNRLYEIAFQMRQTSETLNFKAVSMMDASEEVSKGANSQAHASESMAAALEELTASVEQIGDNATAVYAVAESTGCTAQEGAAAVRESVKKMRDIADRVTQSASAVTDLKELSKQIGGIVSAIRGIAEQTNLLALNAAIEAARAGEYGRGFAVVADEVRVLAGRTADSTKEITAMVDAIQDSTTNAVAMMEAGVHEVEVGVEIAETAGNSVASIEAKTAEVVAAVHDIQHVLQEQAQAAREVARTVEDISGFAHSNAQSADNSLRTSKDLVGVAKVMDNISCEFKT